MKNLNLTLEEYLETNSIDAMISKYLSQIKDTDDEIDFINQYIYDVLNGLIPIRNENEDESIEETVNLGDIVYIIGVNGHPQEGPGVDLEQFQGYDAFSEELEDFKDKYRKDFDNWLNEDIRYKIESIIEDIEENIVEDKIIVYRGMSIDKNKQYSKLIKSDKYKELGVCWTPDIDCTEQFAYTSGTQNKILLKAKIKLTEIYWEASIELRLSPSLGEDESEIRLFDNSLISLINVTIDDEEVIELDGKLFKGGDSFYDYNTSNLIDEYNLYKENKDNRLFEELKTFGYKNLNEFETAYKLYKKKTITTDNILSKNRKNINSTILTQKK